MRRCRHLLLTSSLVSGLVLSLLGVVNQGNPAFAQQLRYAQPTPPGGSVTALAFAQAVLAPDALANLVSATFLKGADGQIGVFSTPTSVQGFPTQGSSWGILGNGNVEIASNVAGSPTTFVSHIMYGLANETNTIPTGCSTPGIYTAYDVVTVQIQLAVPPGAQQLTFKWKFATEENPTFKNDVFQDFFTATVITPGGGSQNIALLPNGCPVSVSNAAFFSNQVTGSSVSPSPPFPNPPDTVFNAVTSPMTATFNVAPFVGQTITIQFRVGDASDSILNSAAFIDNVSFGLKITTVAGTGVACPTTTPPNPCGDGGLPTSAQLNFPRGVAVGGSFYIADRHNHRIRKVANCPPPNEGSCITTVAGNGVAGFSGDGAAATSAQLFLPSGVAVDAAGNLYIADFNNQRSRKVTAGTITTVAGNGAVGGAGDGGPATGANLWNPKGVAWGPKAGVPGSKGYFYIADEMNQKARRVDLDTGTISTIAGTGVAGFSATQLNGPLGVAADGAGNVFIADTGNNRIQKVNNAGTITTLAGTGVAGFSGDGGAAAGAQLRSPAGVTVDAAGNVFIADTGNNRIRWVSAFDGNIRILAGTGVAGFSGDGGAAAGAQLSSPTGVAVDGAGNVFIADTANHVIRKVGR